MNKPAHKGGCFCYRSAAKKNKQKKHRFLIVCVERIFMVYSSLNTEIIYDADVII